MKQARLAFLLCLLPLLCGCGALPRAVSRLETLRVVETLGVDGTEAGLRLSLATAARENEEPVCLCAEGPTLSAALARVESLSTEETLFRGHIRQLVVGADAALEPLLSYVGRSADLRLDTPLYLLDGASAETLLTSAGDKRRGVTEILNTVRAELDYRSRSRDYHVGRILQDLERQGSALLCVLSLADAAEQRDEAGSASPRTAAFAGFAVIRDGEIIDRLTAEELLPLGLLRNALGVQELSLQDANGDSAALEIRQGSSRVRPVWRDDGSLQGLDITVKLSAALLEAAGSPLSDRYIDDLTARLETAVSERLRALLLRSKALGADFLGLGPRVEAAAPLGFHRLETDFPSLLPMLEISLTVQGQIQHEYDLL